MKSHIYPCFFQSVTGAKERVDDRPEPSSEVERRAAELEAVFRALNDRCVRIDYDGRILRLLAGYPAYLPADRVEGKLVGEILAPEDAQKVNDALAELKRRGAPVTVEYAATRADGKHYLEARLVPFGEREVIAVLRDVSDRHRAVEALREAEERLRGAQKMEAIGRLAGGVAHDFNNLLTIVLSCADLIARVSPADSPAVEYLAELSGAAERGAALTHQLLAFSYKQPTQPRVLDLNVVVHELEKMLARLIGENVELVTQLGDGAQGIGSIRADRGQVEQILVNLVVNARDALGEKGGRIVVATASVAVTEERDPRGELAALAPGNYVSLVVRDNGVGMTETVKAHLFEPFFTTKARGKGTGIGLATVYGIVKQSGGAVRVRSAPGEGAELEVLFPAVSADMVGPAVVPTLRAPAGGNERVLLVEDEAPVRRIVYDILVAAGYRVLVAANGEAALKECAECEARGERPDLLLSDVVMPEMGGRELAARVRRSFPGIPVLFMSGYDEEAGIGNEPIIEKPFSPSALERRVREVIDGPKSGRRDGC